MKHSTYTLIITGSLLGSSPVLSSNRKELPVSTINNKQVKLDKAWLLGGSDYKNCSKMKIKKAILFGEDSIAIETGYSGSESSNGKMQLSANTTPSVVCGLEFLLTPQKGYTMMFTGYASDASHELGQSHYLDYEVYVGKSKSSLSGKPTNFFTTKNSPMKSDKLGTLFMAFNHGGKKQYPCETSTYLEKKQVRMFIKVGHHIKKSDWVENRETFANPTATFWHKVKGLNKSSPLVKFAHFPCNLK